MPHDIKPVITFLVALLACYVIIPKLANIAKQIGLLDEPGGRKKHEAPCPLVGGLGIAMSFCLASLLFVPLSGLRGYFAGVILLVIVGFFDDFKELGHWRKFTAQIVATLFMIYFSKVWLHDFGNLLGLGRIDVPYYWLGVCLTIFCVVGVINSLNMIDGIDGLAGGLSFVSFISFTLFGAIQGDDANMLVAIGLAGGVFGFLRYNWQPASVFMGDAGSLGLGFSLAYLSVALTQQQDSVIPPVAVLLVLAVPITDTLTLMFKRVLRRKNPFTADRYHLHHIILRYGLNTKNVAKVIIGLSMVLNAIAVLGVVYNVPQWCLFLVFAFYFGGNFFLSFFILKLLRLRLKFKRKRDQGEFGALGYAGKIICRVLEMLSLFRKDKRHEVRLKVCCKDEEFDEIVHGLILNISLHGCILQLPNLRFRRNRFILEVTLPDASGSLLLLTAAGVWFSETDDGQCLHGVQFVDLSEKQVEVLEILIKGLGAQRHPVGTATIRIV